MAEVAGSIPVGPTNSLCTQSLIPTFVRQRTELLRLFAYGGYGFPEAAIS